MSTSAFENDFKDCIIGSDTELKPILRLADIVASSDVPVFIHGETGTGKEVIARYVHEHSLRAEKPFLKVNCGAIPAELVDSYLFGHEKGSFTGAFEQRKGWFETANGGTLFLDEIGELPLFAQVRFLRVLQEQTIMRVGSSDSIKVDVRIIVATHRNLRQMIHDKKFREDLWYRISVFPLHILPLRERKGDIAELVKYFVERAAAKFHLRAGQITEKDIDILENYSFPGNVRELSTLIERAVLLGGGKRIALRESFDTYRGEMTKENLATPDNPPPEHNPEQNKIMTLDETIRHHIESILSLTHGVIEGEGGAAELLDINPNTLRFRMQKLGIDWNSYRRK
ncbi:hypothetical protein FACS189454_06970 [Planctomycetales bacterium]|nr:hypothetical protein FACS189454_06970 [Planctomycetales bacterium]